MTLADEVIALRSENALLHTEMAALRTENAELHDRLTVAVARLAELEGQQTRPPRPPAFVKPNRPQPTPAKGPRRKRAPAHNRGRQRATPTRMERHALERCPTCAYRLTGESVDYIREVIELPPPVPVEVTAHQVIKRYCPHCQRWHSPHLDLSAQVSGQGRIGHGIASLVAYLRTTLRLPIRSIQDYLQTRHRLHLSSGELVALLDQVREAAADTLAGLQKALRQSPVLHADETGWRQDGQNGYVWTFATAGEQPIRYYEHDPTRRQAVVQRIVGPAEGERATACLVSDFYCGYNDYAGPQQRCWVHLLRDLHDLKVDYADRDDVRAWATAVRALYDRAQAWRTTHGAADGQACADAYRRLVRQAVTLGRRYAQEPAHPCQALAKRLLRHQDELFQFVARPEVPADNNLAERAVRPLVVMRKISGGSRSARGTSTRLGLASLFGTWQARGLDPLAECLALLRTPAPRAA